MLKLAKKMSDIAAEAGVSVMTVHRAIHNHPGINSETKNKILKIISDSMYRPNAYARAMRNGKFFSIGLATEQSSTEMASLVSIFRVINSLGISLSFAELPIKNDSELKSPLPKLFTEHMVDGVIIHSSIEENEDLKVWLRNSQTPFIVLMKDAKFDSILPDFEKIIRYIQSNVADYGYKKIIYLGPVKAPQYHPSYYPYKIFSSLRFSQISKKVIPTDIDIPTEKWKKELCKKIRKKEKTAILSFSDEARVVYAVSQKIKKKIPSELGIFYIGSRRIFCDDGTALSGFIYSSYELGEIAAKMILKKIENPQNKINSEYLPFKIVPGETAPKNFFDNIKTKGE